MTSLGSVVQVDRDGSAGSSAPVTILTLKDVTLSTIGNDAQNWVV